MAAVAGGPSARCQSKQIGPRELLLCPSPGDSCGRARAPLQLTFRDGKTSFATEPDADKLYGYELPAGSDDVFGTGAQVAVSASGAEVPAFGAGTAVMPAGIDVPDDSSTIDLLRARPAERRSAARNAGRT